MLKMIPLATPRSLLPPACDFARIDMAQGVDDATGKADYYSSRNEHAEIDRGRLQHNGTTFNMHAN